MISETNLIEGSQIRLLESRLSVNSYENLSASQIRHMFDGSSLIFKVYQSKQIPFFSSKIFDLILFFLEHAL